MDCTEVFFKLVEIPIAAISAIATAGAAFFAYRAFKAQAKQLRDLEEDRMFSSLCNAPRFIPDRHPIVVNESLDDEPDTLLVPKLGNSDSTSYKKNRPS